MRKIHFLKYKEFTFNFQKCFDFFPVVIVMMTLRTLKAAEKDVKSDLRVKSGPLQFPAVTVCNRNPLRMSQKSSGGNYFDRAMDLLQGSLKRANRLEGEPKVSGLIIFKNYETEKGLAS